MNNNFKYIYYNHINKHINHYNEKTIILDYKNKCNINSLNKIVLFNIKYVIRIAKKYSGYRLSLSDIIQEGIVGLIKSINKFDVNKDVKFISFAVYWIKAEIHEYIFKNWKIVKGATTNSHKKLFFKLKKNRKNSYFNSCEIRCISKELGVKYNDVVVMESYLTNSDINFDNCLDEYVSSQDYNFFVPSNYLFSNTLCPSKFLENSDYVIKKKHVFRYLFNDLDNRSKYVLFKRWLIKNKSTFEFLSLFYNVSIERVRQIELSAVNKMRIYD